MNWVWMPALFITTVASVHKKIFRLLFIYKKKKTCEVIDNINCNDKMKIIDKQMSAA